MSISPQYPTLYEINIRVWLSELSRKKGTPVDLSSAPSTDWDAIAKFGFDAVWFMGVWERSPAGIAIANQNTNLLNDFRRTLSDFKLEDNVGSPCSVRRHLVDKHLGGPAGLAIARQELANRGQRSSSSTRRSCASWRSVFCLRTRFVRISAESPMRNSNCNSATSRSNQRACPLASMPTRTFWPTRSR
jgi:hypothetical protein